MSFSFRPGALIAGTYRTLDLLGRGGMGVVLRARDEQLERDVAIKLIRPDLLNDALRAQFLAEARAMASVSHPNVLPIYSFGEHEGSPFFVTKIVHGETVDQWLADRDPALAPDLDVAFRILEDTCRGVAAIHAAGTVHRDLKPSNVLFEPGGAAYVADMGVALVGGGDGRRDIAGTPDYMAPESILQEAVGPSLSLRADVYSLGCLAFELLTGSLPFRPRRGGLARMLAHVHDDPARPSSVRPDLGAGIDAVILKALEKDPRKRTPSAGAFLSGLLAARAEAREPERILVVEDDDDFRATLSDALPLEFPVATIECVADGSAALEAFHARTPSVAIVDLAVPKVDGMQLTQRFRRNLRAQHVPIVVMTGSGGSREWKHLAELGADGFLVKPVNLRDLATLVRRVLAERTRQTPLPPAPPQEDCSEDDTVRQERGAEEATSAT